MTRRRNLIAGGVGAAALAALGYRLWDRGALELGKGPALMPGTNGAAGRRINTQKPRRHGVEQHRQHIGVSSGSRAGADLVGCR